MRLPESIISERDARIYEARKSGMSFRQIAAGMNISPSTAHDGYMRFIRKQRTFQDVDAKDALTLQLDQLNTLLSGLWPLTRPHTITNDDGDEIRVPPSMEAVDRVLKILTQISKLQGIDKDVIQIENTKAGPSVGGEMAIEATPEHMAKELATQLIKNKIISGPMAEMIEKMLAEQNEIIDGEVIEETDLGAIPALSAGYVEDSGGDLPPPWIDDEEEDIPGAWVPDDAQGGHEVEPER